MSANEIFVDLSTIELLLNNFYDDCDCVIPYLTVSDLPSQANSHSKKVRYPLGMTLNVNMFKKTDLIEIGKVPIELSGYFNDVVMFYNLTKVGKKIKLVDAGKIVHLGQSTTSLNTTASFKNNKQIFIKKFGKCTQTNNYTDVNILS